VTERSKNKWVTGFEFACGFLDSVFGIAYGELRVPKNLAGGVKRVPLLVLVRPLTIDRVENHRAISGPITVSAKNSLDDGSLTYFVVVKSKYCFNTCRPTQLTPFWKTGFISLVAMPTVQRRNPFEKSRHGNNLAMTGLGSISDDATPKANSLLEII
jgi:hypothetical protein